MSVLAQTFRWDCIYLHTQFVYKHHVVHTFVVSTSNIAACEVGTALLPDHSDAATLGVLCAVWEMYTGESLFKGLTVGQVFFMVVYEHHRPAIPEYCPEGFADIMRACWSIDPLDR